MVAQHGMMIGSKGGGDIDVSYLADTVLLFLIFQKRRLRIKQAISVFKKRTGPHKRTIHELVINSKGINIGEPLRGFTGIMTGVPEYSGSLKLADDKAKPSAPKASRKLKASKRSK